MSPAAPRILLAEDDPDIQENLRMFLESEGYAVISAENGELAWQCLMASEARDRTSDDGFCVLLLDLMMPVMTGYELIERINRDGSPRLRAIPIILLSAAKEVQATLHAELRSSIRNSKVTFIKKPFSLDTLQNELQKHCPLPKL